MALDEVNNHFCWAMSEISKGMSDGNVNLAENLCGIICAGDLEAEHNITKIYPDIERRKLRL